MKAVLSRIPKRKYATNGYSQEGLSISALGGVTKLLKGLGHNVPTNPRTILKTTKIKVGDKSFHHFSLSVEIIRKFKNQIIRKRELKTQAKMWLLFISTLTVFPFSRN
jgi:hypothetical protein